MDPEAERHRLLAQAGAMNTPKPEELTADRDDRILAELHRLQSEVRSIKLVALAPRNGILRLFIRDLENNPHSQYKVHRWGMWWWVINFPLVTALFFLAPSVWLKWGLYITLIYSIYANFSTDFGAMSAAMAAYEDRYLPPIPLAPFLEAEEPGDVPHEPQG